MGAAAVAAAPPPPPVPAPRPPRPACSRGGRNRVGPLLNATAPPPATPFRPLAHDGIGLRGIQAPPLPLIPPHPLIHTQPAHVPPHSHPRAPLLALPVRSLLHGAATQPQPPVCFDDAILGAALQSPDRSRQAAAPAQRAATAQAAAEAESLAARAAAAAAAAAAARPARQDGGPGGEGDEPLPEDLMPHQRAALRATQVYRQALALAAAAEARVVAAEAGVAAAPATAVAAAAPLAPVLAAYYAAHPRSDPSCVTSDRASAPSSLASKAAAVKVRGGVPALRVLTVIGCDGVRDVGLRHGRLRSFSVARCKRMLALRLQARQLDSLSLRRCDELEGVELLEVRVEALALDACSQLSHLLLDAPLLESLLLKGCGFLALSTLDTPRLLTLDASFCGALTGGAIQGLARSPRLHTLLLSACTALGADAMQALAGCGDAMRVLDLSYSSVDDLARLVACAPNLTSLDLASCTCLSARALRQLLLPADRPLTEPAAAGHHAAPAHAGAAWTRARPASSCDAIETGQPQHLPGSQAGDAECVDRGASSGSSGSGSGMDWQLVPVPTAGVERSHALPAAAAARSVDAPAGWGPTPPLPHLRILDLSYCRLPEDVAARLLHERPALHTLTLSGCEGVTAALWPSLHRSRSPQPSRGRPGAGPKRVSGSGGSSSSSEGTSAGVHMPHSHPDDGGSSLASLALVKCGKLSSLCLGLVPAPGCVLLDRPPRRQWEPVPDVGEVEQEVQRYQWAPTGCLLSSLTSLKLGLSGVQVLALRLPRLTHLSLDGCASLRVLELRCPLLLTLHLQACNSLARSIFPTLPYTAFSLLTLDLQQVRLSTAEKELMHRVVGSVAPGTKLLGCKISV
ncbi:MAG: hypothetical protein WDW36_008729 [Sanguina aurantia]